MKNIIRIESEQKYELNKLYENVGGREGVFACIEVKPQQNSFIVTFEVVWQST
ncbi:hypothetical protein RKK46_002268 [Listeria innocua]|uniref:hypothetical protein n=1 Tax=Listeria cossartiae TaxID=2838249 RepID=UPI001993FC96|nr:hypothetical protein [Listeria cossartiae]EIX7078174.1 hypothetical protein [Listeria innocua]HCW3194972.1 hypothetical protein [Listeria monocytogenes]EIX7080429.1 hypothetical protein [Listeria innocua]EIX7083792.1 hypothetical protein [Listeria innocua]EIX7086603.1 hypothetical protein [Listeria innocua]